MRPIIISMAILLFSLSTTRAQNLKSDKGHNDNPYYSNTDTHKLNVGNEEWKKILPANLYAVAREQSTERPFTGRYWNSSAHGTYYCAVCGNVLFRSDAKFASDCGWPSFFEPIRKNSVIYRSDDSYDMHRTEVICADAALTSDMYLMTGHPLPTKGSA